MLNAKGIRTIELRGGPADGTRVAIAYGLDEATVPVNSTDKFGAWVVYRPTSERCADGTEIWDPRTGVLVSRRGLGAV